jgi:hypothetical protein
MAASLHPTQRPRHWQKRPVRPPETLLADNTRVQKADNCRLSQCNVSHRGEFTMRLATASAAILTAAVAAALPAAPASAQSLSSGDFAQCTVYDGDGRNRGLDSVCLERKRTQISRLQNQQSFYNGPAPYSYGSEPCPLWANGGRGFSYTVYSYGTPPVAAAFDSVQNGRPCMPQLNIRLPGVP